MNKTTELYLLFYIEKISPSFHGKKQVAEFGYRNTEVTNK
jgi:hypothetical protein